MSLHSNPIDRKRNHKKTIFISEKKTEKNRNYCSSSPAPQKRKKCTSLIYSRNANSSFVAFFFFAPSPLPFCFFSLAFLAYLLFYFFQISSTASAAQKFVGTPSRPSEVAAVGKRCPPHLTTRSKKKRAEKEVECHRHAPALPAVITCSPNITDTATALDASWQTMKRHSYRSYTLLYIFFLARGREGGLACLLAAEDLSVNRCTPHKMAEAILPQNYTSFRANAASGVLFLRLHIYLLV